MPPVIDRINPPNYYDYDSERESAHDLTVCGRQDDIVIAVMGATGTGKSSFIRLLTGDTSIKIGDDLESETCDIQVVHFRDPDSGRKVTIVDTPGFDDSRPNLSNTDILKKITDFLLEEYDQERKLNGLLYLQRISDPRFSGQSGRNMRMFRGLCGEAAFKNVVILTTYWDQVPPGEGERREEQLKSNFLAKFVEGGAQFMRHDCTVDSARKVLRRILPMPAISARIQKEIREEGKSLLETAAGSVQSKDVEDALAKYKNEIAELTEEMEAVKASNEAARRELEEELAGLQNMLAEWEREKTELKEGLDEERELRKQLEAKLEAQLQQQMDFQSLSKSEQAKALRKLKDVASEAVEQALREARKKPLRRRMMDLAEDIPLLPNVIGKPILGGIGFFLDVIRNVLR